MVDRKVKDHLRGHLENRLFPRRKPSLGEIKRSQWDDDFIRMVCNRRVFADWQDAFCEVLARRKFWNRFKFFDFMYNRMLMGAYRYGLITDPDQPQFDNVGSIIERVQRYQKGGNLEHMVDVSNLAMVEYVRGCCLPDKIYSHSWMSPTLLDITPAADLLNTTSLIITAGAYISTGHKPHLVDIAVRAWAEFSEPCCHPTPHFSPVDDGYHTQKL